MKIKEAELRDKDIKMPVGALPLDLACIFGLHIYRRMRGKLERIQERTKSFNCWIAEARWGNIVCIGFLIQRNRILG